MKRRLGQIGGAAADLLTSVIGTWGFLLTQSVLIWWWVRHDGLPPLIHDNAGLTIINLVMSIQAAEAFVIVLMSQNRQAARDRSHAERDSARIAATLRLAESNDRTAEQIERLLGEAISLIRDLAPHVPAPQWRERHPNRTRRER